jgi:excisionase family DNA binding protein
VVQLLNVVDVAERLRISRSGVYKLFYEGHLPSVKVRGARRVTVDQLNAYIARLEDAAR